MQGVYGTVYYVAPEVVSGQQYDERCDVWSVGVIMYIMLTGTPPFFGNNDDEVIASVKQARPDYSQPIWSQLSPMAKDLVQKMLTFNWMHRPTAAECLKHPWFDNSNQKKVDPTIFQGTLQNMARFNATNKLQQGVMTMMVMNMTSKKEQAELQ